MIGYEKNNINPKGIKASDCVVRAIAMANGLTWETAYRELCEHGIRLARAMNEPECWKSWIEVNGWRKMPMPKTGNRRVRLFEANLPNGLVIVSTARHLACVKDGVLLDSWDCRRKCIGNYWVK